MEFIYLEASNLRYDVQKMFFDGLIINPTSSNLTVNEKENEPLIADQVIYEAS